MQILVCRPPAGEKDTDRIEEIQLITDEEVIGGPCATKYHTDSTTQPKADNYHCTWTKDSKTGAPLLCVAGANAKIKIYNIVKGTLERVKHSVRWLYVLVLTICRRLRVMEE